MYITKRKIEKTQAKEETSSSKAKISKAEKRQISNI